MTLFGSNASSVIELGERGPDKKDWKREPKNIEQGITNIEGKNKNFIIRNSLFDIRYSFLKSLDSWPLEPSSLMVLQLLCRWSGKDPSPHIVSRIRYPASRNRYPASSTQPPETRNQHPVFLLSRTTRISQWPLKTFEFTMVSIQWDTSWNISRLSPWQNQEFLGRVILLRSSAPHNHPEEVA